MEARRTRNVFGFFSESPRYRIEEKTPLENGARDRLRVRSRLSPRSATIRVLPRGGFRSRRLNRARRSFEDVWGARTHGGSGDGDRRLAPQPAEGAPPLAQRNCSPERDHPRRRSQNTLPLRGARAGTRAVERVEIFRGSDSEKSHRRGDEARRCGAVERGNHEATLARGCLRPGASHLRAAKEITKALFLDGAVRAPAHVDANWTGAAPIDRHRRT